MQRGLQLGCLVLMVVGFCSRPAEAGLPDWLQELSGPGPFHTDGFANMMARVCFTRFGSQPDSSRDACLFLDHHRFINKKEDNFFPVIGEVRAATTDVGATWRLWSRVDVGAGGGFVHFHTSQEDTTRGTLVARVQTRPIILLGRPEYWEGHRAARNWASVLKVYLKRTVILGNLQGDRDFGAKGSTFDVENDGVWSWGFLLDFSELLP